MERYDLPAEKLANEQEAGALRIASETDEKNCGCNDAAVTPSNLHNVLGCRKANTAYTGNEIVACPYKPGLLLKCVQAGTTGANALNTANATAGQTLTDGGVKWSVILKVVEAATQAEAEGGTDNTKGMTPFRTKQAIWEFAQASRATNPIASVEEDTHAKWFEVGAGVYYINANVMIDQPAQYGFLYSNPTTSHFVQIFRCFDGSIYVRGCQSGVIGGWKRLDTIPVGTIIAYAGDSVPSGFVDCSGAAVNRATYADLFSVIGTTYGSGNGSTTFNLPNLNNNSFLEGSDTVGTVKSAGLPNANGRLDVYAHTTATYTNPFYKVSASDSAYSFYGSGNVTYTTIGFDMNKANSIYGNSDTVQPKAVTVRFCIKY